MHPLYLTVVRGEYDCPISLHMDSPNASFTLSGTGGLYTPGTPIARDRDPDIVNHMYIGLSAYSDDEATAVAQLAHTFKNNIKLDMSQFKGAASQPRITFGWCRIGKDDPYMDLEYQTEWKDVLTSASDLKKNEKQMQIVVDPAKDGDASIFITQTYELGDNKVVYLGQLRTADESLYGVQGKAQLYVPYPSGIDADNADEYIFTIEYPTLSGKDVLSSKEGTIVATPYGLQFSAARVMPFEMVWRKAPSQETQEGEIVGGEKAFEDLPAVDAPTLVFPDGKEVDLPGECELCFPYPSGLNENSARKYRIIIHHYGEKATEVFKSENGDIEFTPQGLCIRIDSFSPFVIEWEEAVNPGDLPKTGDDASILLYGMLLMLSAAAMLGLMKLRSRA